MPYIVVPGIWDKYSHNPKVDSEGFVERGALGAVIFGDTVYPVMVGDSGPRYKMGEASLIVAKMANEKASGTYRAITGPKATYIVFPNTGKLGSEAAQPDFDSIQTEVRSRIDEMVTSGESANFHSWKLSYPK